LATKVFRKPTRTGPATRITLKGKSFIAWSLEPRSYVRIRRVSARKLRT
jgi:hypothetical protein